MWLRRLQRPGVYDPYNKYYDPNGKFNIYTGSTRMPNCTAYSYLRAQEEMLLNERDPYLIRSSGGFGNAKTWYDTTPLPKGHVLREGAIAVFDGNCGHVAIVEKKISDTHAIISESNYDDDKSLRNWKYWQIRECDLIIGKSTISGIGPLIGYIYVDIEDIRVVRDTSRDQVRVNYDLLNVRQYPSSSAPKYDGCFCPDGIFNVLDIENTDGYTWYKLEDGFWIAGIDEVEYLPKEDEIEYDTPEPVERNKYIDQVFISTSGLRMRKEPSTNATITGHCEENSYYDVLDDITTENYIWYCLGQDAWIAGIDDVKFIPAEEDDHDDEPVVITLPQPVAEDSTKNQIYVGTSGLRIRTEPSSGAEIIGHCKDDSFYDVMEVSLGEDYTWYGIGDSAWVAGIEDVTYYPVVVLPDLPEPVSRDMMRDQVYIGTDNLRIREEPSLSGLVIGHCDEDVFYNVLNIIENDGYIWYQLDDSAFIASVEDVEYLAKTIVPEPVERNDEVDQVFIGTSGLRMRDRASLSGYVTGYCEENSYYDVSDTKDADGYTWYRLGHDAWIAGIDEVEYLPKVEPPTPEPVPVLPTPVEQDSSLNQVFISNNNVIGRKGPSSANDVLGKLEVGYYNVFDIVENEGYTWYELDGCWIADEIIFNQAGEDPIDPEPVPDPDPVDPPTPEPDPEPAPDPEPDPEPEPEPWVEPQPVPENEEVDQVYVGTFGLRMRSEPSTKAEVMGVCVEDANYDVFEVEEKSDYTWYKIGDKAYIAQCDDDIIFYPAGTPRLAPILKEEIPVLKDNLDLALSCVNKNECRDAYEELHEKVAELNDFISKNFDTFEYDYVDPKEYNEIDLLYTTDVHGAWVGYDEDGNYLSPVFNYDDVSNYRSKLEKNNIKAFLVDCGDWSRPCRAYDDYIETGVMVPANEMNAKEYFASTCGNHEWRWSLNEGFNIETILNTNNSMTACNIFKNGELIYPAYRTAKIGSKRLAVIGVAYPSANGQETYDNGVWTYGEYKLLDDVRLFAEVQKHIDNLKANGFDYIVVITHMCKSTYESDSRYYARTDSLIKNTRGLTAVIQGHYNYATNAESIADKGGNSVLLAHEAGANMNSFGRLQLDGSKITSYLLDEQSDLKII